MFRSTLLLLLLFTITVRAQNLVPNAGFDMNVGCPNQIGQIDKADGWSVWGGTPDYFHSCANSSNPIYGTPYNNRGYRTPRSGDAYIGLFTYSIFMPNGREFVGRPLSAPMTPGTTYYFSMYVCQADVAVLGHTTNNIGVRFSTVSFSLVNPDTALNNAHIWATNVIADSVNWVKVSGSFVADSAYTHIGIGNYFSDSATTIVPGTALSNYAYYMIDDICVSDEIVTCDVLSAIDENAASGKALLFPNPASDKITVLFRQQTSGFLRVFDNMGKIILEKKVNAVEGEKLILEMNTAPAGIYNLMVNDINMRFQLIIR